MTHTDSDQRADTAFLVGSSYGRRAQAVDIAEWLDDQMQALPDYRTPVAHGKAELLRDLRNYLAPLLEN